MEGEAEGAVKLENGKASFDFDDEDEDDEGARSANSCCGDGAWKVSGLGTEQSKLPEP